MFTLLCGELAVALLVVRFGSVLLLAPLQMYSLTDFLKGSLIKKRNKQSKVSRASVAEIRYLSAVVCDLNMYSTRIFKYFIIFIHIFLH